MQMVNLSLQHSTGYSVFGPLTKGKPFLKLKQQCLYKKAIKRTRAFGALNYISNPATMPQCHMHGMIGPPQIK